MPGGGIIFLTGAPEAKDIDWTAVNLLNDFQSPAKRILEISDEVDRTSTSTLVSTATANWRRIPSEGWRLNDNTPAAAAPLHTFLIHDTDGDDFIEHSFAVQADLESSPPEDTTFQTTTSFVSSLTDFSDELSSEIPTSLLNTTPGLPLPKHPTIPISDLKTLPSASHLLRIRPQTVTANLIVAIISISPVRTVTVRKSGHEMQIIELLVGDDTSTGFSISTWLSPPPSPSAGADAATMGRVQKTGRGGEDLDASLRRALEKLRPGDLVLVERLALSVFRGKVYGQTLHRRSRMDTTSFRILDPALFIAGSDEIEPGAARNFSNKVGKVQGWIDHFIGPSRPRKRKLTSLDEARAGKKKTHINERAVREDDLPPDDTQWL